METKNGAILEMGSI